MFGRRFGVGIGLEFDISLMFDIVGCGGACQRERRCRSSGGGDLGSSTTFPAIIGLHGSLANKVTTDSVLLLLLDRLKPGENAS